MASAYWKILVVIFIIIGEALSIYAEMVGARNFNISSQPFLHIFSKMFLLITLAGGFLIAGYILGFNAFKNIWIVSAVSVTSILIVEPVLAWTFFGQMPTVGAGIGLAFGVLGFLAAVLI